MKHCDVSFTASGGGETRRALTRSMIEDHQQHSQRAGAYTFSLRCTPVENGAWTDRLREVDGNDLEISVIDPVTPRVLSIPPCLRLRPERLQQFLRPDRTTVIDVNSIRVPDDRSFILV